jgi:hypothetical protein
MALRREPVDRGIEGCPTLVAFFSEGWDFPGPGEIHHTVFRQEWRFLALTTMQNRFAGINPDCSVRSPMTHISTLLAAQITQPSQRRRPTKMVERTVSTQDK